jgi:hypothetical protein
MSTGKENMSLEIKGLDFLGTLEESEKDISGLKNSLPWTNSHTALHSCFFP